MMLFIEEKVEKPELVIARYNVAKVRFHRKICLVCTCINMLVSAVRYREDVAIFHLSLVLNFVAYVVYRCSLRVMEDIACQPLVKDETIEMEFNCDSALGLDMKDIVIITNVAQLLACFSLYCWGLMFTIYFKIICMLTTHMSKPGSDQPEKEEEEYDYDRDAKSIMCNCPMLETVKYSPEYPDIHRVVKTKIHDQQPRESEKCALHERKEPKPTAKILFGCTLPIPDV